MRTKTTFRPINMSKAVKATWICNNCDLRVHEVPLICPSCALPVMKDDEN
jgi:rubrerythrin